MRRPKQTFAEQVTSHTSKDAVSVALEPEHKCHCMLNDIVTGEERECYWQLYGNGSCREQSEALHDLRRTLA